MVQLWKRIFILLSSGILIRNLIGTKKNLHTPTAKLRQDEPAKNDTTTIHLLAADEEEVIIPHPQHKGICEATRWNDTVGNHTVDEEYDFFANMVNTFASHGIQLLLSQGSLLGARRHFGFIPWDMQDVDFMVFSINTTAIEHILKHVLKLNAVQNNDGEGPGNTGFGYHIATPPTLTSRYVDFWLFDTINATHSGCVGIDNGCKRWFTKYKWKNGEPPYFVTSDLACSHIPFGPWMFPSPHNVDEVLNKQFIQRNKGCSNGILGCILRWRSFGPPNWPTNCRNQKTKEQWKCSKSKSYGLVHTNDNVHTLKEGGTTKASFSVKNGIYSLLE